MKNNEAEFSRINSPYVVLYMMQTSLINKIIFWANTLRRNLISDYRFRDTLSVKQKKKYGYWSSKLLNFQRSNIYLRRATVSVLQISKEKSCNLTSVLTFTKTTKLSNLPFFLINPIIVTFGDIFFSI